MCGEMLPADFFVQPGYPWQPCHSCTSDYGRQRREQAQQAQPPAEKKCTSCKLLLPAASFSPDKTNATGLYSRCRECASRAGLANMAVTAAVPDPPAAQPPTKYCPGCRYCAAACSISHRQMSLGWLAQPLHSLREVEASVPSGR